MKVTITIGALVSGRVSHEGHHHYEATEIVGFYQLPPVQKPWITREMRLDMEEQRKLKHQRCKAVVYNIKQEIANNNR